MHVVLVSLGASDTMGGGLFGVRTVGYGGLLWGAVGLVGYKVQWVAAVVEWPAYRRWDFFPFIICYTGNQTYTSTLPPRNTPSLESFKFDNVILLCFCHLCYEHVKKISQTNGDKPVICLILVF